jgi:hypothetical protein
MDSSAFWRIVEQSRRGAEDVDEQVQKLYALVRELGPEEILEFDRCFQESVKDSYRADLWAVAYIINGGCSDDGFDYFLGWLIAQGRRYYEAALEDPERAGDRAEPGDIVECERIWSVAARAYEDRTGKTDFYKKVRPVYRTLIGELFDEEKVDALSPKLAERFRG